MTRAADEPTGYRQLADLLRRQIVGGDPAPGQRLPSEVDLQQRYGLGRHTVRRAIALLRAEGLVVVQHGYGAVVAEQVEKRQVAVPAGTVVTARMPTPAERDEWGIPDGVPMLVGRSAVGETVQCVPADRFEIVVGTQE